MFKDLDDQIEIIKNSLKKIENAEVVICKSLEIEPGDISNFESNS